MQSDGRIRVFTPAAVDIFNFKTFCWSWSSTLTSSFFYFDSPLGVVCRDVFSSILLLFGGKLSHNPVITAATVGHRSVTVSDTLGTIEPPCKEDSIIWLPFRAWSRFGRVPHFIWIIFYNDFFFFPDLSSDFYFFGGTLKYCAFFLFRASLWKEYFLCRYFF